MNELAERLILRYNPGQFSFRRYDVTATDAELYALAKQLNSVQADEASQIIRVKVYQLR